MKDWARETGSSLPMPPVRGTESGGASDSVSDPSSESVSETAAESMSSAASESETMSESTVVGDLESRIREVLPLR